MGGSGRIAVFFLTVLSIWTLMHLYAAWRLSAVAASLRIPGRVAVAVLGFLWLAYPLGRILDRTGWSFSLAVALEYLGACWMGVLFLLVMALLAAELLTGFGAWQRAAVPMRGALAAIALLLAGVGLVQGNRPPVIERHEVFLPKLPPELDGLKLCQLSDLHLGTILGRRWLEARLAQVQSLAPDLVVVTGDLVDGNARHVEALVPLLAQLRAPLGVFAVTGNHEYYAGLERSVKLLEAAGYRVLRDTHVEVAPGLVLAGVDDLTARRQFGAKHQALEKALQGRPPGACILLSHTPWDVTRAEALGVQLMLSGHTHGGQIWPFGILVRLSYPYLEGLYQVGSLWLYVSRGTGTWGPRMRLWRPAEVTLFTLRSSASNPSQTS